MSVQEGGYIRAFCDSTFSPPLGHGNDMLQIEVAASICFLDLERLKAVPQLIHKGLEEHTVVFLNGDLGVNTTSLSES